MPLYHLKVRLKKYIMRLEYKKKPTKFWEYAIINTNGNTTIPNTLFPNNE